MLIDLQLKINFQAHEIMIQLNTKQLKFKKQITLIYLDVLQDGI